MRIQLRHRFEDIISLKNLCLAWQEFLRGKRGKPDVQAFGFRLMENIIALHEDLREKRYRHGGYESFRIADPKPRQIHKASVRDRLLHHAIYRILYPFFDRTFIADSFSCRLDKGTHRAINRFRALAYQVSRNHTRTCWVLKCDIRKFFASIDHTVLRRILQAYIPDERILWLLDAVIESFSAVGRRGVGLPLGNLTSQLFANVYMNEFDQFAKHRLKAKHYVRYADDFVILSEDKTWLEGVIPAVSGFLQERMKLVLHNDKIFLKTFASGMDFLGWVHFSDHRILRGTTKRRMARRLEVKPSILIVQSYLGLLKHGNAFTLQQEIMDSK